MKVIDKVRLGLGTKDLYRLVDENNKLLNELNWANVFNNTISESKWLKNKSFSPGRSAIGYPLLYLLYRILEEINPQEIIEFGLGQSSRMLYQYAEYDRTSHITTIEHDESWVSFFCSKNLVPENSKLVISELEVFDYKGYPISRYSGLDSIINGIVFDLIIIDGPIGSDRYSRIDVLDFIPYSINPANFCIIMDDFNRPGEKDTCFELEEKLMGNGIRYCSGEYNGIKSSKIFCSTNLKFVTTL